MNRGWIDRPVDRLVNRLWVLTDRAYTMLDFQLNGQLGVRLWGQFAGVIDRQLFEGPPRLEFELKFSKIS